MRSVIAFAVLFCAVMSLKAVAALEGSFEAQDMDLVLKLSDGRVLRGETLSGMTLVVGKGERDTEIRIDGVALEAHVKELPITFYRMSVKDRETGVYRELCERDPDGERAAFAYPDGARGFSLTCTSGAEGKCILLGYFPWKDSAGVPMSDLHRACIHMMRADYGGDNKPTARNGTPINIIDRFGIQNPGHVASMEFEAAWGPDGAICVAHPRVADNVTFEQLAERYPQLRGRLGPHVCYEQVMRSDPRALIFNESVLTWRTRK
ncbi:ADYC domain-containing protein [Microvirga flavescens]|uniref:ADYC domain-containing protein n=1 Tax=Microvirga flavescens TaxID=2249811 RepID=UPI000DD87217|nr:ADYC domain-containing protein [Microvirga flavescens]